MGLDAERGVIVERADWGIGSAFAGKGVRRMRIAMERRVVRLWMGEEGGGGGIAGLVRPMGQGEEKVGDR